MTTQITAPAVQLLVQTQQMSDPMTSYGQSLIFDFGKQIQSGQQILAYSVALSGFLVQYATQSDVADEQVQQFAIGLVPSLVGSQVVVTSNILLADYDGDAASETQDVSGRESYALVTVIAIIGSAPTNTWTLTNTFWLQSGGSGSVNIPSFTNNLAYSSQYIAGFDFLFAGDTKEEVNGFKLITSSTAVSSTTDVVLNGSVTMSTDDKYSVEGTVSLGFLASENPSDGEVLGFEIIELSDLSWSSPNGSNGMTASFSQNVNVPSGYQISNAAFLMSYIYLDFDKYHDLQIIGAGQSGALSVSNSNNTVSGSLLMNLYSDEGISKYSIQSDSSLTGSILVAFEPIS